MRKAKSKVGCRKSEVDLLGHRTNHVSVVYLVLKMFLFSGGAEGGWGVPGPQNMVLNYDSVQNLKISRVRTPYITALGRRTDGQ